MRFYYYTDSIHNFYIDDWKNKRYINLKNREALDMPRDMRMHTATEYYGDKPSGHPLPDLCVILLTGKAHI